MKALILLIAPLLMFSCTNSVDTEYIKTKTWVYNGGYKIGKEDFVTFFDEQKLFQLKGDTIYYHGSTEEKSRGAN